MIIDFLAHYFPWAWTAVAMLVIATVFYIIGEAVARIHWVRHHADEATKKAIREVQEMNQLLLMELNVAKQRAEGAEKIIGHLRLMSLTPVEELEAVK